MRILFTSRPAHGHVNPMLPLANQARLAGHEVALLRGVADFGRIDGVRTLLNIIWLVLCGFWMALAYVLAGIVCCLLIITIPFGLASFRIATFALWPFGRTIQRRADAGAPSTIGNVIWIIFAGIWLAIGHVVTAIALALTIIGIPLAVANLKLIPVSLTPLGRVIVPINA